MLPAASQEVNPSRIVQTVCKKQGVINDHNPRQKWVRGLATLKKFDRCKRYDWPERIYDDDSVREVWNSSIKPCDQTEQTDTEDIAKVLLGIQDVVREDS
jgi:hypothetical protein